jgi:hypothetical protein
MVLLGLKRIRIFRSFHCALEQDTAEKKRLVDVLTPKKREKTAAFALGPPQTPTLASPTSSDFAPISVSTGTALFRVCLLSLLLISVCTALFPCSSPPPDTGQQS